MAVNKQLKEFVEKHDKREEFTDLFKRFNLDTHEIFVRSEKLINKHRSNYKNRNESNTSS